MPYPTDSLAKKLDEIDRLLIAVKVQSQNRAAALQAGGTAHQVVAIRTDMITAINQLNTLKTTPGLGAYAREQKNDPLIDVVAEFNAVLAAMQAVVDEIVATFPTDGSGYLLREKWGATDTDPRVFSAGALSQLRTKINDVVGTIN